MKKFGICLIVFCGLFVAGASLVLAGGGSLPKAEGDAVYTYITQTSPYRQWALFPGTKELYTGKHPHGALLTTYVNEVALSGIQTKAGTLADGSIIVKENYMPDKMLGALTVMYRVKGYDAEAGDWFWAKYMANGQVEAAGKVGMCSGCHAAVIPNDWVFTGPVK